jgi:hypothetical protein
VSPRPRLVARENELDRLGCRLDAALAGETAVAFVSGDAGSGKTALLEAFAASALEEHPDLVAAGARCGPGGSADPFGPLRRLAEMLFGDLDSKVAWHLAGQEAEERLQDATGLALACLKEHGPDLAGTLIPVASITRRAGLSSDGIRGWPTSQGPLSQGVLFDQLLCTLAAIARQRPLLLLLDDLHWVDDATAAFLLHLGRELSGSRLLVLGAYRPEPVGMSRRDPVTGETTRHPLASAIDELRRLKGEIVVELGRADGRAFVEAYVDTEPNRLGARFRDALYAHTGGHALFTVESLRNLQERGELLKDEVGRWVARGSLDWGSLPARIEAAIAERIERLPEREHRILSAASVQGDDFTGELVAEVTGRPVREVITCLSASLARQHHLVRSSGLSAPENMPRAGSRPASLYRFTHHLFQKYLYDQLDAAERGQMHVAIAAGLDRQASDDPAERERLSAQLAWHYEAGGMPLQAARALHDAGQQAMRVSAFREAMNLYEHGLALLADASRSRERSSTEWIEIHRRLELARLGPRRHFEGLGGPGLAGAAVQASEAGPEEARGRPLLMLLWAQTERLYGTGQFEAALAVAGRLRAEAGQCGDEDFAAIAGFDLGLIHHYAGNPRESEGNLDRVLLHLTPERRAGVVAATGIDMQALALGVSALNRWFLGYPEAALARSREAIDAGRGGGIPVGQAAANALGAALLFFLRIDEKALAEQAGESRRVALEHGLIMWQVFAEALVGRLMVMQGHTRGLDCMGHDGWRTSGMAIGVDLCMLVLADGCLLAAGRCEPGAAARVDLLARGLAAVDSMLGPNRVPCGQIYEAELRRLEGELLLARDGLAAADEALACFGRAMECGREKGALAWELRAAMSLVRLRERQGVACAASAGLPARRVRAVH